MSQNSPLKQAQEQYQKGDFFMQRQLDLEHDYICKQVDPILHPVVEKLLVKQPKDVVGWMARHFSNESNEGNDERLEMCHKEYYVEKVKPVMTKAILAMVEAKPEDKKQYLANYFKKL